MLRADFARRAQRYRLLDAEPAIRMHTRFFAAAATICEAFSFVPPTAFIGALSEELETFNLERARLIRDGSLYPHADIERNTIEFVSAEQAFVEERLDRLHARDVRLFELEIHAANRALRLVSASRLLCRRPALRALASAAGEVRELLQRCPRFEQRSDRELIGRQLAIGRQLLP